MVEEGPSLGRKVWFWIILGMSSVFFAEVTVGSQPFPFFVPFSILVVVPLYTLHILVLGTVVIRGRRVTLGALFIAGIIFGLYEAYITKVIWDPYWEFVTTVHVAEVAVIQTMILVLWYHNFFAFIIPLAVVETYCTRSRKVFRSLPAKVRARFDGQNVVRTLIILGVVFGMLQAASSLGPLISIASVGSSGLLLFAMMHLFGSTGDGVRYTIDDLLPNRRQFSLLLALLLIFYAVMTAILLPENLPGPVGHAAVLLLYAAAFALLWRELKTNAVHVDGHVAETSQEGTGFTLSVKHVLLFLAIYVATAAVTGMVPMLAGIVALCIHIGGVCIGVVLVVVTALGTAGRA